LPEQAVEVFRAVKVQFAARPAEGRTGVTLEGDWVRERATVSQGALFVPIAQPKARLVMALLEPRAPESFAAWGFFNAHFEQKEYMEAHVAEQIGREMLASRPEVAAEFRGRLESDPQFARDPAARLEFFHSHHPSWDERLNLYPLLRIGTLDRS